MDSMQILGQVWAAVAMLLGAPAEPTPAPAAVVVEAPAAPTPAPTVAPELVERTFSGSYSVGGNTWTLTGSTFTSSATGVTYPMARNGNRYSVNAASVVDCLDARTGAIIALDSIHQAVAITITPVVFHDGRITAFEATQTITRTGIIGTPCDGASNTQTTYQTGA